MNTTLWIPRRDQIKEDDPEAEDHSKQKIIGVRLRDTLTGKEWNTFAKVVVNSTGLSMTEKGT